MQDLEDTARDHAAARASASVPPSRPARAPLLRVRNASQIYRMGEVDVVALRDATLDLLDGELLVILGPSGSGKSTLLNLIGGMARPSHGHVSYRDLDLSTATDRELTDYRRRHVGFVFQFYNLVPSLTALENVQVASEIADDPMDPLEALSLVGLGARADHFPSQLSGGEQQRVSIARAMVKRPGILLCDEPTGALDINTGRLVLDLLVRMRRELNQTIAVITHNGGIAHVGDRVASIKDGVVQSIQVNERPLSPEEIEW